MTILDRLVDAKAELVCARRYGVPSTDGITQIHIEEAERILGEVIAELRAAERQPTFCRSSGSA